MQGFRQTQQPRLAKGIDGFTIGCLVPSKPFPDARHGPKQQSFHLFMFQSKVLKVDVKLRKGGFISAIS